MSDLGDILAGDLASYANLESRNPAEERPRKALVWFLFVAYGEPDAERARVYHEALWDIPLPWLAAAVEAVKRSHRWSKVPTIGEIWLAAQELAGIGRAQYTGRGYIAAPATWPPAGQRHGAFPGKLEAMPAGMAALQLAAPKRPALASGGSE